MEWTNPEDNSAVKDVTDRARTQLVDLYRSEEDDRKRRRPHRTPARIACVLLRLLLMRFPGRAFVFVGDSAYGTHQVARFCHRHRARLALVSRLHPDANLFDPPPPYTGKGRPRVKGARLPKPRQVATTTPLLAPLTVSWYGGGTRRVGTVQRTGHWYKGGEGLVPLRWVFVRDLTGTHREEFFFTTDTALTPAQIIGHYCGRWNIEMHQADCPSSGGWVWPGRIGYHRRDGVARTGRVVPATSRQPRRSRPMSDSHRHAAPPAPDVPVATGEQPAAGVGASARRSTEATPRIARSTARTANARREAGHE